MNRVGRFMQDAFSKGQPFRNQLTEIRNQAGQMTRPAAREMSAALSNLLADPKTQGYGDSLRDKASRMAGGKRAIDVLQMTVPGVVAGAGVGAVTDIIGGGESVSNDAMDLLGMGAGAAAMYGVNRGVGTVGNTTQQGALLGARSPAQKLAIIASALGGKGIMDTLQGG